MNRTDPLPTTHLSVLEEAGRGDWERFWGVYLKPCLEEIARELRRIGLRRVQPEELLEQLYGAIAKPARFRQKYRELLEEAGQDPEFQGNLPAKFCYLLNAFSGKAASSRARFRTLLRRVIRRSVAAQLRRLIDSREKRRRLEGNGRPGGPAERPGRASLDSWADRLWIVQVLRATCRQFFHRCDRSRTRARQRYPRLLYHSLVSERTQEEIAARENLDRTWVGRQLAAAEECFAGCLRGQYPPDEKDEVRRALAAQNAGLIAVTYRETYREWYGPADAAGP